MKLILQCLLIALVLGGVLLSQANAQQPIAPITYIDSEPSYRKWQDDYNIDKIEYTTDHTILHFSFRCKNDAYTNAIFYPSGDKNAWYLEEQATGQQFNFQDIRNVHRNGVLMQQKVTDVYTLKASKEGNHTIFSCEVYFERLPSTVKTVDLIEGKGNKKNKNYFNCFDVKVNVGVDLDTAAEKEQEQPLNTPKKINQPKPKPAPEVAPTPEPAPQAEAPSEAAAPKTYTDYKPVYKQWQKHYSIDKIEYTEEHTIVHFRCFIRSNSSTSINFYPPQHRDAWLLQKKEDGHYFYLREIRNVSRNGVLMQPKVLKLYNVYASAKGKHTSFSCAIYFERLPEEIKTVDLIEGKGREKADNYFNCFDIKLKTWEDEDLGSASDMEQRINTLEEQYTPSLIKTKKKKSKRKALTPLQLDTND